MMRHPVTAPGFTLVEMAIVLIIVTVLMGGLVVGLSSQYDSRAQAQTEQTLSDIKEALLGYAVSQQRLPCPAAPGSTGGESFGGGGSATNGLCSNFYDGLVPGSTLGITPVDTQGYVLDGWNQRMHYAVSNANSNAFTASGKMKTTGMSTLNANLYVCASGSGVTTTTCGTAVPLSTSAVAVIYSIGKNGASGGSGMDEKQNPNPSASAMGADTVFVSHAPMAAGSTGGEFDDIVTWISPYTLFSRMITAGQLP